MAETENLKELVEKKEPEFTNLHKRMDDDANKNYFLEEFKLKKFDGTNVPKVVSTTLNDSSTFAYRAIAILS